MIKTDILIIGAGLSGLSCAYHLEKAGRRDYLLIEKEAVPGGLCGSIAQDGFTFDWSGHLLHLHTPEGKALVNSLLGGNASFIKRSAWIYSHGVSTAYPFQANTYGLPPQVVSECVQGFIKAWEAKRELPPASPFRDWALSVFGEGICRHFMFPYNLKLWQTPLDRLTADWCAPFVPRPAPEEVIRGAYWEQKKSFGYNAGFLYPKRGGIGSLAAALMAGIGGARFSCALKRINFETRTAFAENIGEISYRRLVSTMPLKFLIGLAQNCPPAASKAAARLKCTSVEVLNLGVDKTVSDKHWLYFPEPDFAFYRAGLASNFSPHVAPPGSTSFYIEAARPFGKPAPPGFDSAALDGLKRCGLLPKGGKVVSKLRLSIPCAYVVYNKERPAALSTLFAFLKKRHCLSIGRYGGWKYSFMEEALLEGKRAAEALIRKA